MGGAGFLNDEYEEKVAELAQRYGVSRSAVERLYLDNCREIQRKLRDGTPRRLVRQLAFDRTESALEDADGLPRD